jgi:hypothetical protein
MSLRLALGVVGGVIGSIYGGPAGARWGFMIGSTIGSVVDPQTIKGPSIGEIANQTAQEGGARPIVFVRSPPIPGNVIDQSTPRIVKTKSGGKGGPKVTSEQVFRTYAIGVCEGPIAGFRRIWRNNVLVYDASEDPQISAEENAAFLEKARLFLGTYDQLASPDLEAIHGAGTTPSYRGTAYHVMADEDLTDMRGAIPQWIYEIASACSYERQVFTSSGAWTPPEGITHINMMLVGPGGGGLCAAGTSTAAAGGGGGGGQVWYQEDIDITRVPAEAWRVIVDTSDVPTSATRLEYRIGENWFTLTHPVPPFGEIDCAALKGGDGGAYGVRNPDGGNGGGEGRALFIETLDEHGQPVPPFIESESIYSAGTGIPLPPNQGSSGGASSYLHAGSMHLDFAAAAGGGGGAGGAGQPGTPLGGGAGGPGRYMGAIVGDDLGDGGYFGGGGGGAMGAAAWTDGLPEAPMIAPGGRGGRGGGGNGFGFGFPGETPPFGIQPGRNGTGGGGGGRGAGPDIATTPGGSGIAVIMWCPLAELGGTSLKSVVTKICGRAGVPPELINVDLLPDVNVNGGIVTNGYAAIEALRSLGQAYLFDLSPRDGVMHFVPRGGNSVATILETELVDDDRDVEDDKRDDSISVPRVLHLNYWDTEGGLATSKQSSERSGDRRSVGEASIQTPWLMTADQAAQNVVVNHKMLAENQKGSVNFALPDKWIGLVTADPIHLQVGEVMRRILIQKTETLDGYQQYEGTYDRQSAYTSNVEGIPAAPQTPPPSSIVGPTLIVPLDIHILRDSDDTADLTYYVAVAGIMPAWQGALIELSYDNGANYLESQTAETSATIGELVTALEDHPQEFPDVEHTFRVRIDTPGIDLEDTTLAGMQSRVNLAAIGTPAAGWELVNFADAEETTANEWQLGYLLRGRKGSEPRHHDAGETFVMLDRSVLGFILASVTDLNRTLTFRATSLGAPTDTGTVVSMVYTGRSQTEREVAYLSARRDGTDAVIEWQGIGRLGGGANVAHGGRFTGYRVRLDDGVNPVVTVDTASQNLTQDVAALAGPITISVVQRNGLTGEGPAVEVILA